MDPILASAYLLLLHPVFERAIDSDSLLFAALTFALTYPGTSPFQNQPQGVVRRIVGHWSLIASVLLILGLITNGLQRFAPSLLITWFLTTPVLLGAIHRLSPRLLPRLAGLRCEQRAVVVGANPLGQALAHSLALDPLAHTRIAAFFDDSAPQRIGPTLSPPLCGPIDAVADYVRAENIDHIYIALPMASQPRILRLLDQLRDTTASVFFMPDIFLYDLI